MKENYKTETIKAYDTYAEDFCRKTEKYAKELNYLKEIVDKFLKNIPQKGKILDVGCGSGNYALLFKNKGYNVVCVDLSKEMIKISKERGLNAHIMDFENLKFPNNSFDGVWAYASVFHIPKANLNSALKQIYQIIKPKGIFYLGVFQGNGESFKTDNNYPDTKRWFSLYEDEELRKYLEPYFKVLFFSETKLEHNFLNYILKKK